MSRTSAEIINSLIKDSPRLEKSEHIGVAASVLDKAKNTGKTARMVSLTCANYETLAVSGGTKIPILHKDLIWNERSLRRGYVAAHEELPSILATIASNDISLRHTVILVDRGMAPQLWAENVQTHLGMTESQIKQNIHETVDDNVYQLERLEHDGLKKRGFEANISRTVRLSNIEVLLKERGIDFENYWNFTAQIMHSLIDVPNHKVAGSIRRALKSDAPYLRYAWGMTSDHEIKYRVIDQTFALTAALGHLLPEIEAVVWNDKPVARDEIIMVDTIPGPDNPGHKEFKMYNTSLPEASEKPLPPLPIIRPLRNTVLFSQVAVESPSTGKTLVEMQDEAIEFGY